MVLTRSKMAKTFVRLPRYGRISINKKMELEETILAETNEIPDEKITYFEENDNSCFTILNDNDTQSILSQETVFSTPTKPKQSSNCNFSPIRKEDKLEINDYELRRQARMKENLKALQDLGVTDIVTLQNQVSVEKQVINKKKRDKMKRKRVLRQRMTSTKSKIRRTSPRLKKTRVNRGNNEKKMKLDFDITAIASMMKETISLNNEYYDESDSDNESDYEGLIEEEKRELAFSRSLQDRYYTCEEYFTLKGIKPELIQENGKFIGWVEENMRKKIGIASDKEQAWEANGGGKFTFKTPTGKLRQAESAKETARKMLFKNPNSYFYRHTAPGLEHWQGDWTEPENKRFLEVAKKHGVGNKWGLFATYIRNRVGYQCSNHYRAHFVEGGVIWDGNFMLDKYGKSIYVGRKNKYV